MEHSYEEIRSVTIDLLSGREEASGNINQYGSLMQSVAEVFRRRNPSLTGARPRSIPLSSNEKETYGEVFWDLFRQGIITLGYNSDNEAYPFFRLTRNGHKILDASEPYFFHDSSSYINIIRKNIPNIDELTLVYLKEAIQAYYSGCILSATVMIGVSVEHTFLLLLETISNNSNYKKKFENIHRERTILRKFNKFNGVLGQVKKDIPSNILEDLDTNLSGILSLIRNYRNEAGHPTGKIINREQCYINNQLFIPCCKKMYDLIDYFKRP